MVGQCRAQVRHRVVVRDHHPDRPALRAADGTLREPRQQPGAQERRLARPGRADQHQQPAVHQRRHELLDQSLTTDEEAGVGDVVPAQALVRARRSRHRTGRDRSEQRRVLSEHLLLERAQLRAGFDAQLVVESRAGAPVGRQRVRLPTLPVERDDQQLPPALEEAVLGDQRLQLGHRERDLAGVEEVGRVVDLRGHPLLLQRGGVGGRVLGVHQVGVRLTAPQRERRLDLPGGAGRVGPAGVARTVHLVHEPGGVQRVLVDVQPVAAAGEGQPGPVAVTAEQVAQPGHVALQRPLGGRRGVVSPDRQDEPVDRDRTTAADQERGEDAALDGTTHRDGTTPVVRHHGGTEQPEPHAPTVGADAVRCERCSPTRSRRPGDGEGPQRSPSR